MSLKRKRDDYDATWAQLMGIVKRVVTSTHDIPKTTWNNILNDAHTLCVAYPEPIAEQIYEETKKFLEDHVKVLLTRVNSTKEEQLLTVYYQQWQEYSQGIGNLQKLFL